MQNKQLSTTVAKQLPQYQISQVQAALDLLSEGNTIPFIARYRKEVTQHLDEVDLRNIELAASKTKELEERKLSILSSLKEQNIGGQALFTKIKKADDRQELEDLYAPYRPKRKTRATTAKEAGLEPLAQWLWDRPYQEKPEEKAKAYLNQKIKTPQAALQGAMDILCEKLSESPKIKRTVRKVLYERGELRTGKGEKAATDTKGVYDNYLDFSSPIAALKGYQFLAIERAEKQKIVRMNLHLPKKISFPALGFPIHKGNSSVDYLLKEVYQDAYSRLIFPQARRQIISRLKDQAEAEAIKTFGQNLYHLLMQPPLKEKRILGIDPAYRTGCKLAAIDETGQFLTEEVIYPHAPKNYWRQAQDVCARLIRENQIACVAIGNGTASQETERLISECLAKYQLNIPYAIVDESGASVYSASALARKEFPNLPVEKRSAISIARRLQDPLAELVKIDPQAIGVGQYQHDVDPKKLKDELDFIVNTVVNQVGVDLNTASASLFQHVSGLSKRQVEEILKFKKKHGAFIKRETLLEVPQIGPKTFEQAAGFLRILNGVNPLDATPVHPEDYHLAQKLFEITALNLEELNTSRTRAEIGEWPVGELANKSFCSQEKIKNIQAALLSAQRDPRTLYEGPLLRKRTLKLEDMQVGGQYQGVVRNVVDFGAFVDLGAGLDGLIHISKMSPTFVNHPNEVVQVGDIVDIWCLSVDVERGRISLSLLPPSDVL